jgi:hypothetical protein
MHSYHFTLGKRWLRAKREGRKIFEMRHGGFAVSFATANWALPNHSYFGE